MKELAERAREHYRKLNVTPCDPVEEILGIIENGDEVQGWQSNGGCVCGKPKHCRDAYCPPVTFLIISGKKKPQTLLEAADALLESCGKGVEAAYNNLKAAVKREREGK
jgi:hypothetical protein